MKHKALAARTAARTAVALAATLALCAGLSGCGHSDSAEEAASSDTVEMPAEEALSGIVATPAPDPSAMATPGTDAAPGNVAMPPAASAAPPAAAPAPAPAPAKAASTATDKD